METRNIKIKKGLSVRTKWILFICLSILLAVGASFVFNYMTASKLLMQDNDENGKDHAKSAAALVKLEVGNYQTSIEAFANVISSEMDSPDAINRINKTLVDFQKKNSDLLSVYYLDFLTGKLHIAPYADIKMDVRTTRTYRDLKANPVSEWQDVYQDATSKKIMTSIVTPIWSNGKMVGAIGYDIDLSTISRVRKAIEGSSNEKLVILDAQGLVVSSFMDHADGKNMNPSKSGKVEGISDLVSDKQAFNKEFSWVSNVYKQNSDSTHDLTWDGKDYSGQITTIPQLKWKVMSFTPTEIFASKMSKFNWNGFYSLILGLLIGIGCAVFLASKLRKIIVELQQVLEKTAKGDLVTEVEVSSNDEIGLLSRSYNLMLQNIRDLINKVLINVDSIKNATGSLTVITNEHSTAITEVSRAIGEIAVGAGNQTDQIGKGSNAVIELGHVIEELSTQSSTIEKEVDEASHKIDAGNKQVAHLQDSYHNLEKAFQQVTVMIANLDEKSKSISTVTHTIDQIAEQTNLLALNASIEAARAGEHGRGFAVVADEVRKLAEGSKRATQDIQTIINSVLTETNALVQVMGETNQISSNQKGAVSTVSTSIKQLTDSLNTIMISIKQEMVSINMLQEQKEVVLQMIGEISAVSQQTSAASEEISAAMEEQSSSTVVVAEHMTQLSELVEGLTLAVNKFDVEKKQK